MMELNGSLVEGNNAEVAIGVLLISNNSLFIALNSSFKGNKAYDTSTIEIYHCTAYLEKCTSLQNRLTYGGAISTEPGTTLKLSNTVFKQNEGYNFFYLVLKSHFINKIETHRCLFMHGNISLKSNVKNFEQLAFKEKVFGQFSYFNQSFFEPRETPYASSKMFQ